MNKKDHNSQQELLNKGGSSRPPFTSLNFFMKATLLSIVLTSLPIVILLALWELELTAPTVMLGWVIFALFWTFYVLLRLTRRFVK